MSARRCLRCLLAALALALPSASFAQDGQGTGLTERGSPPPPPPRTPPPSQEDLEVMQNLELLENLDESSDLELMQELTVEQ